MALTRLTEHQFHTVWTVAVEKEGYNKELFHEIWEELQDRDLFEIDRAQAKKLNASTDTLPLHGVVFSEAELKAKLDQQKEEMRQWLEGEGYELLAERL